MNTDIVVLRGVVMDSPQLTSLDLNAFPFLTHQGEELAITVLPAMPQEVADLLHPNAQVFVTVHEHERMGNVLVSASRDETSVTPAGYRLIEYDGYTVDFRLKEFRKIQEGQLPEFHRFDSAEGQRLMTAFRRSLRNNH